MPAREFQVLLSRLLIAAPDAGLYLPNRPISTYAFRSGARSLGLRDKIRIAMGRRSTHTPQQLSELILDAARDIIDVNGLAGLSAREIARRIGYSPGTIYNMFQNLDDVVLNVEARVLDQLDERLAAVLQDGDANDRLRRLAHAYLAFTQEKPRLWNLLFEHHLPAGTELPSWYKQKLEQLMGRVEQALAPMFGSDNEADRQRAARVLWAGVHGITSLSTADKLSVVTTDTAGRLIDDLVGTYLKGLTRQSDALAGTKTPDAA
jgi:AcrR family transcriptional regulator